MHLHFSRPGRPRSTATATDRRPNTPPRRLGSWAATRSSRGHLGQHTFYWGWSWRGSRLGVRMASAAAARHGPRDLG